MTFCIIGTGSLVLNPAEINMHAIIIESVVGRLVCQHRGYLDVCAPIEPRRVTFHASRYFPTRKRGILLYSRMEHRNGTDSD